MPVTYIEVHCEKLLKFGSFEEDKMAILENDIIQGRVYIMDYYDYVQVLTVGDGDVSYRSRRIGSIARMIQSKKTLTLEKFAARARAEVNGEYFPDFTDLRGYSFDRRGRKSEIAILLGVKTKPAG